MSIDQDAPSVTLGGKRYRVPELSARRIIKFAGIMLKMKSFNPANLNEEEMIRFYEAVLIGIQQDAPDITLDQFLDMPISFSQLTDAVFVIGKQAGMEFKTVGEEAAKAGPATPSTPEPLPSDGTTSSPN